MSSQTCNANSSSNNSGGTGGSEWSWIVSLLQTADPLFPTGAYAHSLGFEEAVRPGLVCNEATLGAFLREHLAGALREQELPYLRFAFEAASAGDVRELGALDFEISAWKLAAEARAASTQIGGRRLQALRVISPAPLLAEYEASLRAGEAQGHHLVVSGLQAAVEGVPLQAMLGAWFYQTMAGVCSAALKLIRIGQEGTQRALRLACAEAPATVEASMLVSRSQAGWFGPMLEIASMRHLRAEERLFIS